MFLSWLCTRITLDLPKIVTQELTIGSWKPHSRQQIEATSSKRWCMLKLKTNLHFWVRGEIQFVSRWQESKYWIKTKKRIRKHFVYHTIQKSDSWIGKWRNILHKIQCFLKVWILANLLYARMWFKTKIMFIPNCNSFQLKCNSGISPVDTFAIK